jgi:hypothetical protein
MVERPKPQQSGMSSLIVGTTLLVVGVSLGTLTLLLGGGILAAVFYLATALLLQYLLWGWWLGPILINALPRKRPSKRRSPLNGPATPKRPLAAGSSPRGIATDRRIRLE